MGFCGKHVWFMDFNIFLMTSVVLTEEEELLNRRMMKYWANFARHG